MIKVRADWLFKYILKGYAGFTFLVFVFYKDQSKYGDEWIRQFWKHEKIHIKQQVELLFVLQWLLYFLFWLINVGKGMTISRAYKKNPFELEANYWENFEIERPWFSYGWIKFI